MAWAFICSFHHRYAWGHSQDQGGFVEIIVVPRGIFIWKVWEHILKVHIVATGNVPERRSLLMSRAIASAQGQRHGWPRALLGSLARRLCSAGSHRVCRSGWDLPEPGPWLSSAPVREAPGISSFHGSGSGCQVCPGPSGFLPVPTRVPFKAAAWCVREQRVCKKQVCLWKMFFRVFESTSKSPSIFQNPLN